jgi:predicted polyphosphate/ATP-dependent NAD kinase
MSAESIANGKLALCVNPMSGRDVRRLAARATNMTHEAKRDIVARVVAGADAIGVTDIYIAREPFRIAEGALELMKLQANVHIIDIPLTNTAQDTADVHVGL